MKNEIMELLVKDFVKFNLESTYVYNANIQNGTWFVLCKDKNKEGNYYQKVSEEDFTKILYIWGQSKSIFFSTGDLKKLKAQLQVSCNFQKHTLGFQHNNSFYKIKL